MSESSAISPRNQGRWSKAARGYFFVIGIMAAAIAALLVLDYVSFINSGSRCAKFWSQNHPGEGYTLLIVLLSPLIILQLTLPAAVRPIASPKWLPALTVPLPLAVLIAWLPCTLIDLVR